MFAITIDLRSIADADRLLARLDPLDNAKLLDGLARRIQEMIRERIANGGPAPDGTAWKPNLRRGSILLLSGRLMQSIDYVVQGMRAIIGSGLIYARIQQEGGKIVAKDADALQFRIGNQLIYRKSVEIPPRPYIGVSAANKVELIDVAARFIRRRLGL